MPLLIRLYFLATFILGSLSYLVIIVRLLKGKEDEHRYREKLGKYKKLRPKKKLIWFHGASIGETLSIIGLIKEINACDNKVRMLITSATKTSGHILSQRMPKNVVHQFVPLDTPTAVNSFLGYWKPDFAIWVESEIWPRLIIETSNTNIPMWIINGKMSFKSFRKWRYFPSSIQFLYKKFEKIYLRDKKSADYLIRLGVCSHKLNVYGSLKASQEKLKFSKIDLKEIKKCLDEKKIWLASSTHPGEDEVVLNAHKDLLSINKDMLLILVPRHPERGKDILNLAKSMKLNASLRSNSKNIHKNDHVYVADTVGELGLWYNLTNISFIGGSISQNGGHNPYEAILSDVFILHGSATYNFEDIYHILDERKCAIEVNTPEDISRSILYLIESKRLSKKHAEAKNLIITNNKRIKSLAEQIYNRLQEHYQ